MPLFRRGPSSVIPDESLQPTVPASSISIVAPNEKAFFIINISLLDTVMNFTDELWLQNNLKEFPIKTE